MKKISIKLLGAISTPLITVVSCGLSVSYSSNMRNEGTNKYIGELKGMYEHGNNLKEYESRSESLNTKIDKTSYKDSELKNNNDNIRYGIEELINSIKRWRSKHIIKTIEELANNRDEMEIRAGENGPYLNKNLYISESSNTLINKNELASNIQVDGLKYTKINKNQYKKMNYEELYLAEGTWPQKATSKSKIDIGAILILPNNSKLTWKLSDDRKLYGWFNDANQLITNPGNDIWIHSKRNHITIRKLDSKHYFMLGIMDPLYINKKYWKQITSEIDFYQINYNTPNVYTTSRYSNNFYWSDLRGNIFSKDEVIQRLEPRGKEYFKVNNRWGAKYWKPVLLEMQHIFFTNNLSLTFSILKKAANSLIKPTLQFNTTLFKQKKDLRRIIISLNKSTDYFNKIYKNNLKKGYFSEEDYSKLLLTYKWTLNIIKRQVNKKNWIKSQIENVWKKIQSKSPLPIGMGNPFSNELIPSSKDTTPLYKNINSIKINRKDNKKLSDFIDFQQKFIKSILENKLQQARSFVITHSSFENHSLIKGKPKIFKSLKNNSDGFQKTFSKMKNLISWYKKVKPYKGIDLVNKKDIEKWNKSHNSNNFWYKNKDSTLYSQMGIDILSRNALTYFTADFKLGDIRKNPEKNPLLAKIYDSIHFTNMGKNYGFALTYPKHISPNIDIFLVPQINASGTSLIKKTSGYVPFVKEYLKNGRPINSFAKFAIVAKNGYKFEGGQDIDLGEKDKNNKPIKSSIQFIEKAVLNTSLTQFDSKTKILKNESLSEKLKEMLNHGLKAISKIDLLNKYSDNFKKIYNIFHKFEKKSSYINVKEAGLLTSKILDVEEEKVLGHKLTATSKIELLNKYTYGEKLYKLYELYFNFEQNVKKLEQHTSFSNIQKMERFNGLQNFYNSLSKDGITTHLYIDKYEKKYFNLTIKDENGLKISKKIQLDPSILASISKIKLFPSDFKKISINYSDTLKKFPWFPKAMEDWTSINYNTQKNRLEYGHKLLENIEKHLQKDDAKHTWFWNKLSDNKKNWNIYGHWIKIEKEEIAAIQNHKGFAKWFFGSDDDNVIKQAANIFLSIIPGVGEVELIAGTTLAIKSIVDNGANSDNILNLGIDIGMIMLSIMTDGILSEGRFMHKPLVSEVPIEIKNKLDFKRLQKSALSDARKELLSNDFSNKNYIITDLIPWERKNTSRISSINNFIKNSQEKITLQKATYFYNFFNRETQYDDTLLTEIEITKENLNVSSDIPKSLEINLNKGFKNEKIDEWYNEDEWVKEEANSQILKNGNLKTIWIKQEPATGSSQLQPNFNLNIGLLGGGGTKRKLENIMPETQFDSLMETVGAKKITDEFNKSHYEINKTTLKRRNWKLDSIYDLDGDKIEDVMINPKTIQDIHKLKLSSRSITYLKNSTPGNSFVGVADLEKHVIELHPLVTRPQSRYGVDTKIKVSTYNGPYPEDAFDSNPILHNNTSTNPDAKNYSNNLMDNSASKTSHAQLANAMHPEINDNILDNDFSQGTMIGFAIMDIGENGGLKNLEEEDMSALRTRSNTLNTSNNTYWISLGDDEKNNSKVSLDFNPLQKIGEPLDDVIAKASFKNKIHTPNPNMAGFLPRIITKELNTRLFQEIHSKISTANGERLSSILQKETGDSFLEKTDTDSD